MDVYQQYSIEPASRDAVVTCQPTCNQYQFEYEDPNNIDLDVRRVKALKREYIVQKQQLYGQDQLARAFHGYQSHK